MEGPAGMYARILGEWLSKNLPHGPDLQPYIVYYDHGDPSDPHVAAIKGFAGDSVKNKNRLADIDIMVATSDKEVLLLIEVEEHHSSPKKLLGMFSLF